MPCTRTRCDRVLMAVTETRDVQDVRTDVPSAEEALQELYRRFG